MTTQTPIINVQQLSWISQGKRILHDISFELMSQQVLGIIGPNGAGKTSLLRCLSGINRDYHGEIQLQQRSLKHYSQRELAKTVAVVNQVNQPVFDYTVQDIVKMGLIPHHSWFYTMSNQHKQQISAALARTDLTHLANKPFQQLSGGEQQRVLIARALVQQAQIILLDEPTNHLDVYYQHQLLALVKSLNLTLVMTLHDHNLAAQYCDVILLLDGGTQRAFGSVNNIITADQLSAVFHLPAEQVTLSAKAHHQQHIVFYATDYDQEKSQ
jgi:iron complex transport system ATP-binding protein